MRADIAVKAGGLEKSAGEHFQSMNGIKTMTNYKIDTKEGDIDMEKSWYVVDKYDCEVDTTMIYELGVAAPVSIVAKVGLRSTEHVKLIEIM